MNAIAALIVAALSVTPITDGIKVDNDTEQAVVVQVYDGAMQLKPGQTRSFTDSGIITQGDVHWTIWSLDGEALEYGTFSVTQPDEESDEPARVVVTTDLLPDETFRPPTIWLLRGRYPA